MEEPEQTEEFSLPEPRRTADIDREARYKAEHPARPGRPTLLTPEIMATVSDLLKRGNYLSTASKYVGLAPETVGAWLAKGKRLLNDGRNEDEYDDVERLYRDFALEIEKSRGIAEIKAVEVIRAAMTTQWQAAAWYLERTNNADWGRTVRTEVSGPDGGAVQVDVDSVYRKLEAVTQRVLNTEIVRAEVVEALPEATEPQDSGE